MVCNNTVSTAANSLRIRREVTVLQLLISLESCICKRCFEQDVDVILIGIHLNDLRLPVLLKDRPADFQESVVQLSGNNGMTIFCDDSQAEVLMQTWGIYLAAVAYIIDFLSTHWDTVKAKDCASEKRSLLRL